MGGRRPTGLARSLTRTRSIGNRSDVSEKTNGEGAEDDDDDFRSNGAPSRTWTIYKDDDKSSRPTSQAGPAQHEDPDDPINRYVQDQLARIKSNESQEYAEELAAGMDGAGDEL